MQKMVPLSSKNVVIIAPHCDDEYLGCSTILKQGNVKKIIAVTGTEPIRREETMNCAVRFNVPDVQFLGFEDGKVITELNFLEIKLQAALHYHPGEEPVVYLPSLWERHLDHKAVSFVGLMVCQGFKIPVVMYSVWDSIPNCVKVPVEVKKTEEFQELYPSQAELSKIIQPYEEFLEYDTLVNSVRATS